MGSCTSYRFSQLKQPNDTPDTNDCVIVDGKNAICTGTAVVTDQTFYRFQFRKEKASRTHSEPTVLIPETSLKDRVTKIASITQDSWIGLRSKTSSLNTSSLEEYLFGHDCRSGFYNNSISPFLRLSGIISHFDEADAKMSFSTDKKMMTGSIYDLILPKHRVPSAVTPVSCISSKEHDGSPDELIHIACNPLSIDSIIESKSVISLAVLTASHHNAFSFGQDFLTEYQGSNYEAFHPSKVGFFMDGIPASFFGSLATSN